MKLPIPHFSKILPLATALAVCASGNFLNAQQQQPLAPPAPAPAQKAAKAKPSNGKLASFAELEKKLHFDKSPITAKEGMVISYAPVLEKAMPAVVTIHSSKTISGPSRQEQLLRKMYPDIPDEFFKKHGGKGGRNKQEGIGSGIVIEESGYIITNNHVVDGADDIIVVLPENKRRYKAKVIGNDPQTDVALIKIDAHGLKTITIGDSSKLRVGDIAFAIGNPMELEQTATQGIISALGRSDLYITGGGFENFIQTDASVNKGNSGGALIDANGRWIGINTAIQSNFGGNIGIAFAIPSNMAMDTVRKLIDGNGTVHRGFLGVYLKDLDPKLASALGREDQSGVLITEVGSGTPAEQYGVTAGDLIIKFNGKKARSMSKLRLAISNTDPGTRVHFDVIRKGKMEKIEVVLGDLQDREKVFASNGSGAKRPPVVKPRELIEGVQISGLDEKVREGLKLPEDIKGVLVKSVDDGTPAAKAGLRSGLVITMIDQRDVSSVKQAYELAGKISGDVMLLQVYSNGRRDILAIETK